MDVFRRAIAVGCILVLSDVAMAQLRSTVQLPTFQVFSMSTTVLVPDRGAVYAGGVNRSFNSSSRRRTPLLPLRNRAHRGGSAAGGVWVSAYIHDLEELDKAVLDDWSRTGTAGPPFARTRRIVVREGPPVAPAMPKVSDVRWRVQAEEAAKFARANDDFQLAFRLEKSGKIAAARAIYRNALKRADDSLTARINSRLDRLNASPVAQRSPAPSRKR